MKDGIYFNLLAEEYHAVEALSSSGIRDLLESPTKFWFKSNFNPLKKEKKSEAMLAGEIFHKAVLEDGLDDFVYDNNELNRNSNAYKDWAAKQTRPIITKKDYMETSAILSYYERTGALNIFKDGFPEVSIIWTEADGTRRKARLDYLTLWGFIDLKTLIKQKNGDLNEYVAAYFYKYKVHIQLVWYRRGLRAAVEQGLQVFGTPEQKKFWSEVIAQSDFLPSVMFLDREFPHPVFKVFTEQYCPQLYRIAEEKIEYATQLYAKFLDIFGSKKAWLKDVEQSIFQDVEFPEIMRDLLDKGEL